MTMKNLHHSEETKRKISLGRLKRKEELGYLNSPETRAKLSLVNKGKILSDEHRKKISDNAKFNSNFGMKGKHQSEEAKEKMSLASLGKPKSEKHKENLRLAQIEKWKNPEYRKNNKGMLGKHQSEYQKEIVRLRREGKTYEEIYGVEKAKEVKENLSLNHKGMLGLHHSEATKEKIGLAHEGNKTRNWKGDNVSINPLHRYIEKRKLKSLFCEECKENKRLTLANIKNHKYTRNPKDYNWLCYSCHRKLDIGGNLK
jgi:hypothetical protein